MGAPIESVNREISGADTTANHVGPSTARHKRVHEFAVARGERPRGRGMIVAARERQYRSFERADLGAGEAREGSGLAEPAVDRAQRSIRPKTPLKSCTFL